jgi:hypothetical protein
VKQSSFVAPRHSFDRYNIEVDLAGIPPFALDRAPHRGPVLWYDLQTHPEGGWPGRLGSGRSGVYRGRYLKGVGRTPAAANWRAVADRYHGSGHLSVGSALRERLITRALSARGLASAIVPCQALLLRAFTPAERRAVCARATSSNGTFAPADAMMAALTVKPADFARPANFVFALQHFDARPRSLGTLFLHFERYLRPPGERTGGEGEPSGIARALDAAFHRAFETFEAFGRMGLLWMYVQGNVTLDGRIADLETPHFLGAPFVGVRTRDDRWGPERTFLGFEEFEVVQIWRLFLAWLRSQLQLLAAPGLIAARESRLFLAQLARAIDARFAHGHRLYDDAALERRAVQNLARVLDLGTRGRASLRQLARFRLRAVLRSPGDPIPHAGWRPVPFAPAPPSPALFRFEAPAFLPARFAPDAEAYATALARLSGERDLNTLLHDPLLTTAL